MEYSEAARVLDCSKYLITAAILVAVSEVTKHSDKIQAAYHITW